MIRTYEDLGKIFACPPEENRISSRVYKSTDCGAWLAFESMPGKKTKTSWFVEVSDSSLGRVFVLRARRAGRREWITPDQFPPRLAQWVCMERDRGERYCMRKEIPNLVRIRNLHVMQNIGKKRKMPWFIRKDRGNVLQIELRGIEIEGPSRAGIAVGSIVEGVDQTTTTYRLAFPFHEKALWDALDKIEREAKDIWNQTHGCDSCGEVDEETGYRRVNPNCPVCEGQGIVI